MTRMCKHAAMALLIVLLSAAGLFAETITINTEADLLALQTGDYVIKAGDTVEFAAGKTFDLNGVAVKGIDENNGTVEGNGATIIAPFVKSDVTFGGFFNSNKGVIRDLHFVLAKDNVPEGPEYYAIICCDNMGVISGCSVDGGGYGVVPDSSFGAITALNAGEVYDCHVKNLFVRPESDRSAVGFITAYSDGSICACYTTNCTAENARYIGGIVGQANDGEIKRCAAWNMFAQARPEYVGPDGEVLDEWASSGGIGGMVDAVAISECASYHNTFAGDYCGGLVGYMSHATLNNSYSCVNSCHPYHFEGLLLGCGLEAEGINNYVCEDADVIGSEEVCDIEWDFLNAALFTDGTLLEFLSGGQWYEGPDGYPMPFEYSDNVPVRGVILDLHSVTLEVGKTKRLTATVAPSDATNQELVWSSYDKTVAKVSSTGKITAVGPGSTTIRVKTKDGGFIDKCKVKVTEAVIPVTGVTISKTTAKVEKGKTLTLKATIAPENATNQNVTWQSYDTSIATVTSEGKVKGIAAGTTTIRVKTKDGGFTAKCKVTVTVPTVPVTGVILNKTVASVAKGKTFTLKAVITPTDATDQRVTWSSYDTSIATVDSDGKVKGIAPGTTTIKVKTKDGGFTAKCKVTVVIPVTGISLNINSVTLKAGKTKTLTATVKPANATVTKVIWTSSNPTVATVNSSGKITAVKKGKATITATTKDGGFKATCAVTVQ
ncbi:MAG: Ig domain-containing protein [Abditibacteriota bacterium]|nr:Ig domain-containing protein [Abditibacteriota bacterium]